MKTKIGFLIFLTIIALEGAPSFAQQIHTIQVPGTSGPSLQQARDEFWQYHSLSTSSWGVWHGNSYIQQNFGITWPNQMLAWDEPGNGTVYEPYVRFTAAPAVAYIRAWKAELDAGRRAVYYDYIFKQLEYLLCLQAQYSHGGLLGNPHIRTLGDSLYGDLHATVFGGVAFAEAYLTFGDQRCYQAVIQAAENLMNHTTYPYGSLGPDGNCPPLSGDGTRTPCTFYSAVNHMGLQLWFLCYAYSLTGSQRYLDRCIALAEEIIAWQDYRDNNDVWWPQGSIPDGGWYWYDFLANPVPVGSPTPPINGSFDPGRKMGYHVFTLRGLMKLLEVTGQQTLPGTVTFRNSEPFRNFKTRLVNSVIKATNYVIDNQETGTDHFSKIRGGLIYYKGYTGEFSNGNWSYDVNRYTSVGGIESVVIAYRILTTYGEGLSSDDRSRLLSFLNGVSNACLGRYTWYYWNYSAWAADGMIPGWGMYLEQVSSPSPPISLSLKNSGFEDKTLTWELWSWDGAGVEISSALVRTGVKSIHIIDNSTSASKWAGQIVSAEPGRNYTVSAYARILNGVQSIWLDFVDENFQRINEVHTDVGANSSFAPVSTVGIAPTGTNYIRIWLYGWWYTTSEGYWDDIAVTPFSVSISGPLEVQHPDFKGAPPLCCTWNAVITGGKSPFSYAWYKSGSGVGTNSSYSECFGWDGFGGDITQFPLQVVVTDALGSTVSSTITVTEYHSGGGAVPNPASEELIPDQFGINQNFPNPFNPETRISFALSEPSEVSVIVSDLLGREIATLISGKQSAGYRSVLWRGTDNSGNKVGSGIYFCRFSATGESGKRYLRVMKMIFAK